MRVKMDHYEVYSQWPAWNAWLCMYFSSQLLKEEHAKEEKHIYVVFDKKVSETALDEAIKERYSGDYRIGLYLKGGGYCKDVFRKESPGIRIRFREKDEVIPLVLQLMRAFDIMQARIYVAGENMAYQITDERFQSSCAFTGHRPEKCRHTEQEIKSDLEKAIRAAMEKGCRIFINGGQRGVDIWAAETVIRLKEAGAQVSLVTASPYKGFEKHWDAEWVARLNQVIESSDEVHYVSEEPGRDSFLLRDQWMVYHSNRLIAVFNGTPGGTESTIEYAKEMRREVQILEG